MRVFLTGGTGAIGRHAVPALLDAGHDVSALARTPAAASALARAGARPIGVSLFDRAALTAAFTGHDAVANLATAIPPTSRFLSSRAWRENDRIRTEGSAAVVAAALAAGVSRVVQESVAMLYPDRGTAWIDEDVPTDRYPRSLANHAAEASANRFTAAGGIGTVLRFGWFYGPGARHSEHMLAQARYGLVLLLGHPDGYVASIHVADAGAAVAAALTAPGGAYNVVDDEPLVKRDFAASLARAAGARRWVAGPGRAAHLFGDSLTSLTRSLRISNARMRTATDWAPLYRSAREGWLATAAVLRTARR